MNKTKLPTNPTVTFKLTPVLVPITFCLKMANVCDWCQKKFRSNVVKLNHQQECESRPVNPLHNKEILPSHGWGQGLSEKSKIEVLCEDLIAKRSTTDVDQTFEQLLVESIEKAGLDQSTINSMIEYLTTATELHSLEFLDSKTKLIKEYADHPITSNQHKVIQDLATVQVNEDNINKQLVSFLKIICKQLN